MDDETKAEILERHGPGEVEVARCELCGFMEWRCTRRTDFDEVVITDMMPLSCPRCTAAAQRAPEIVNWVAGIATKLRQDLEDGINTYTDDTRGTGWACGNSYTITFATTSTDLILDLPSSSYVETWPETGDPPPPWLRPSLPALPLRSRRRNRRLPSTLPCRLRQSPIPGA